MKDSAIPDLNELFFWVKSFSVDSSDILVLCTITVFINILIEYN